MRRWWYLPVSLSLVFALVGVGCFDSLVTDGCQAGFAMTKGVCVAHVTVDAGPDSGIDAGIDSGIDGSIDSAIDGSIDSSVDAAPDVGVDGAPDAGIDGAPDAGIDAGPDAGIDAAPDAGIDAPVVDAAVDAGPTSDATVCTAPELVCRGVCIDVSSDPDNCGGCGRVCASGVCAQGTCAGALRGHVIAIGHDYRSFHPAMARVIGNAVALGVHYDVPVARWSGTVSATSQLGTTAAITGAMAAIGRPWHAVAWPSAPTGSAFAGIDVLIVDAQRGDGVAAEAAGAAWHDPINAFVTGGGIVVVLEGVGGVSYRFARGAGLYTIAPPVDVTGQLGFVVDGASVTTQQVVSPYLAETSSVGLPGAPSTAIATALGTTIVFDVTR